MFNKSRAKISKSVRAKKENIKKSIYKNVYQSQTIDPNLILFESGLGRNYTGNPKAIYEQLLAAGLDKKYTIYWVFEDTSIVIPGQAGKVVRGSLQHLKLLSRAQMWIFDTRQPNFIVKNPKTHYIMTWHGTPLKKLALDLDDVQMAGNNGIESYKANFWNDTRSWDYLIAQNEYSSKIFEDCFDFRKTMLDIGYPRNDKLVNCNNKEYIDKIKTKHGIPKDKKVVLYAPTWRDYESKGRGKYIFNPQLNFDILKRALKDEYVFIVKYHYLIASSIDWRRFEGFIYDINEDIADLYLMSDIMMTDYSSVMFDYSVLGRPMIFYTYDLNTYGDNRGFYFDFIGEVPGPFAYNTNELIEILNGGTDFSEYKEKYHAFQKKFNSWDDGKASEKVVKLISDIMEHPEINK